MSKEKKGNKYLYQTMLRNMLPIVLENPEWQKALAPLNKVQYIIYVSEK